MNISVLGGFSGVILVFVAWGVLEIRPRWPETEAQQRRVLTWWGLLAVAAWAAWAAIWCLQMEYETVYAAGAIGIAAGAVFNHKCRKGSMKKEETQEEQEKEHE